MFRLRYLLAAFFVVLALAGGAWFLITGLEGAPPAPESATVFTERRALPEFELVDGHGRPFTRDRLRGRTSLLFFGFTHCPDVCPATLQQLALARRQLSRSADAGEPLPDIVFISVDPDRDSPETLRRYVDYFGSGVTGVTGDLEALRTLTGALGIHFERAPAPAGSPADDYTINHTAAVLVIDPEARLQAIFGGPHSVSAFVHDLPFLMATR